MSPRTCAALPPLLLVACGEPAPEPIHASLVQQYPAGEITPTPLPDYADTVFRGRLDVETENIVAHTDISLWIYEQQAQAIVAYVKHVGEMTADGTEIPSDQWAMMEGDLLTSPRRLDLFASAAGHSLRLDLDMVEITDGLEIYGFAYVDDTYRLFLEF